MENVFWGIALVVIGMVVGAAVVTLIQWAKEDAYLNDRYMWEDNHSGCLWMREEDDGK